MKKAFTLAETLLTLSVIGIIAAMTLPEMINDSKLHGNIVKFRKTYSVLSNAFQMYETENGSLNPKNGKNWRGAASDENGYDVLEEEFFINI